MQMHFEPNIVDPNEQQTYNLWLDHLDTDIEVKLPSFEDLQNPMGVDVENAFITYVYDQLVDLIGGVFDETPKRTRFEILLAYGVIKDDPR